MLLPVEKHQKMPELKDRDDSEAAIAALLASIFNDQRGELKRRLGDPPRLSGVTESFWIDMERKAAERIRPKLKEVHAAAALQLLDDTAQPVAGHEGELTQEAVLRRAEEFSQRRSVELAQQMTSNTRQKVEKIARDNAGAAAAIGIGVLLIGALGAGRAERAAITEVTDAAARGELDTVAAFEVQTGLTVVAIWVTERDARVCPICRPLDGRPVDSISLSELGPQAAEVKPGVNAHVGCRCHLTFKVAELAGV